MQEDIRELYDNIKISQAINDMADKIIASNQPICEKSIALVGLYSHGVPLAQRLAKAIKAKTDFLPNVGKLDISMYRDDVGLRSGLPLIQETVIPFNMDHSQIILVDDVLSSGRTIRAALDALNDYGRPASIQLAVLVDRGGQEYPIRADYIGYSINVEKNEKVIVQLGECDNVDSVIVKRWQNK